MSKFIYAVAFAALMIVSVSTVGCARPSFFAKSKPAASASADYADEVVANMKYDTSLAAAQPNPAGDLAPTAYAAPTDTYIPPTPRASRASSSGSCSSGCCN